MNKWTESEDSYLATHYATIAVVDIGEHLGRTRDAVYYRAKTLGLRRENQGHFTGMEIGKQFQPGNVPWNAGTGKKVPTLREKIAAWLAEHREATILQLSAATGSTRSSCWKACDELRRQGNLHIVRYSPVLGSNGNWEAVYRIGHGEDAVYPIRKEPEAEDPYEVQPVPRPVLGAWGLSWNTTTPASAPAERIV